MKKYSIIVAIFIVLFSFAGCNAKEKFDYKVTFVPGSNSPGKTLTEMNTASEIISGRLNKTFGIPQESIKLEVNVNKISITISKADTAAIASIKEVITGYNRLEFCETYENSEITGYLSKANNMLETSLTAEKASSAGEFNNLNPLFVILKPMLNASGEPLPSCMIGLAAGKDTSAVNKYFKTKAVKALFPADLRFFWSAKPYKYDPSKSLYGLHAIKVTSGNEQAPLDGSAIISAKTISRSSGSDVKIDLSMSAEGARKWAGITRRNINRCIAVIYNGSVRSYPRVQNEISGGNTEITGDFSIEEANNLVNMLNSGQLPFELKIINEQIIRSE